MYEIISMGGCVEKKRPRDGDRDGEINSSHSVNTRGRQCQGEGGDLAGLRIVDEDRSGLKRYK